MSQSVEARLSGLRNLADLEPPAGLEAATLAAMAAAGGERHAVHLGRAAAWAGLVITGLLVAALALDIGDSGDLRSAGVAGAEGDADAGSANADPIRNTMDETDFMTLLEQSNQLEQILAVLEQREVMRASTAGTIAGLEHQIAQIDAALWSANGQTTPPEYRVTLMRDRVETMNALLNVRYSQSRAFSY